MLKKLLFSNQRPSLLVIAVSGAFVGMLLLLGALQLYVDFHASLNGSDIGRPQYLVINKKVSMLNTFFGGQKGFSAGEMNDLKKINGVKNVAPLTACHFRINVTMGAGGVQGIPGMYSEIFFEAVPDGFLDVSSDKWQWKEGDSTVPIVVPRDYIKLYNFGFAPAQGLPQLTEEMVSLAHFHINVDGPNGGASFHGQLAGFTERINSILAPQSFVDYANEKFANIKPQSGDPSRVIIQCDGAATSEISDYLVQNGYETGEESMRLAKLNSWLRIIMNIVAAIGCVIIVLAILCFMLYSQLLISRSSYELETLIRIGYDYKMLRGKLMRQYFFIFNSVLLLAFAAIFIFKLWLIPFMSSKGFDLPGGIDIKTISAGIIFTTLFLGTNFLSITTELRRLAK